jgi:hypothetical protein
MSFAAAAAILEPPLFCKWRHFGGAPTSPSQQQLLMQVDKNLQRRESFPADKTELIIN